MSSCGDICRVCGSEKVIILHNGEYARFFQIRVDITNDEYLSFSRFFIIQGMQIFSRHIVFLFGRLFRFISKRRSRKAEAIKLFPFRTDTQYCMHCRTVQPRHEYSENELRKLYVDYRLESYNKERISVEPSYKKQVNIVGVDEKEIEYRNAQFSLLIRRNFSNPINGDVLDFGGSDGLFIPKILFENFREVHSFDISQANINSTLSQLSVQKISCPTKKHYSLLTCMHVMEHVGNPIDFFKHLLSYVLPGGYIYIEFPLELTSEIESRFKNKTIDFPITIHEHINLFSSNSLRNMVCLFKNLEIIDSIEDSIGRYLIRVNNLDSL